MYSFSRAAIFISLMTVTLVFFVAALNSYMHLNDQRTDFQREAQNHLSLVDALSTAAKLSSITGEPEYAKRHLELEARYNASSIQLIELAAPLFDHKVQDVLAPYEQLMYLEKQAIDASLKADTEKAQSILQGAEYTDLRDQIFAAKESLFVEAISFLTSATGGLMAFTGMAFVLMLITFIASGFVTVSDYRRYRLSTRQFMSELEEKSLQLECALSSEKTQSELINQFVATASHEFRTPLTIIDATARRLEKNAATVSPGEIETRTQKIRAAVERMSMLAERTLETARTNSGQIELQPDFFDPSVLIADIVQRQSELTPGHTIRTELANLPNQLCGDVKLLDNVFSNVISNAIKYSPSNPIVEITTETNDAFSFVIVKDFGVGIPENEVDKIASRFFRASTAKGISGTGIGLNLAKALVEQHDGQLNVESVEGEWTKVRIALPLKSRFECDVVHSEEQTKDSIDISISAA